MNNLRKIILLSFWVLSCNESLLCIDKAEEEKGNGFSIVAAPRITEEQALEKLLEFVPSEKIKFPENCEIKNFKGCLRDQCI